MQSKRVVNKVIAEIVMQDSLAAAVVKHFSS